ncbi:MAG: hypothetical protein O7G85_02700 [Planctomycetota bacterium]|nr:hypothetical protein [Planctomycetota bacterium]
MITTTLRCGPSRELSSRTLLSAFLSERDVPCPGCAYNLRSILMNHCPECGMPLYLMVRGTHVSNGLQFARLLTMALPLGFNLIFTMIGFVGAMFARSWRDQDWVLLVGFAFFTILFMGGLTWVMATTKSFHQRPRSSQFKRVIVTGLLAFSIQASAIALMLWLW